MRVPVSIFVAAMAFAWLGVSQAWAQTVNTSDIFDGAVTSDKILDGTIKRRDLGDGIINAAKIEDHAVAAAKLGLANIWFIEDSGNDTTNCTRLRNRLTAVTGPALILLGPGTFDCGTNSVAMQPNVDIRGSGRDVTKIKGHVASICCGGPGVVVGASDAELSALTVVHTGPTSGSNASASAIDTNAASNFTVNDVKAIAQSDASNTGCAMGILVQGGSVALKSVRASGDTGSDCSIGVYVPSGTVTMTHVNAAALNTGAASGTRAALYVSAGTVTARDSIFDGDQSGVEYDNSGGTINLVNTQVIGAITTGLTCFNVYDDTFSALACP